MHPEAARAGATMLLIVSEIVAAEDAPLPRAEIRRRLLVNANVAGVGKPFGEVLDVFFPLSLERGVVRETPEGLRLDPEGWKLVASACAHQATYLTRSF